MLADESFAKALRSLETCVLVNNNLCGKLFSSLESPKTFEESLKVTLVPFFIADFNLLSCEFDNFTFKVLYWDILYSCYIRTKILEQNEIVEHIYNTFTVPCEKYKMVSFFLQ